MIDRYFKHRHSIHKGPFHIYIYIIGLFGTNNSWGFNIWSNSFVLLSFISFPMFHVNPPCVHLQDVPLPVTSRGPIPPLLGVKNPQLPIYFRAIYRGPITLIYNSIMIGSVPILYKTLFQSQSQTETTTSASGPPPPASAPMAGRTVTLGRAVSKPGSSALPKPRWWKASLKSLKAPGMGLFHIVSL